MKIGVLDLDSDVNEHLLETFNGYYTLEIEQFSTPYSLERMFGNAIATFLGSMKSVKDIVLDYHENIGDCGCWVDLIAKQGMLRSRHLNQESNWYEAELSEVVHAVAMHCPHMQSLKLAFCD